MPEQKIAERRGLLPNISRRFKREIVSLATLVAFLFAYLPFMESPWAIYAAVCAGYTVLVLGLLWSDGKWAVYVGSRRRTSRDLIQGHLVFILVLILWIWFCQFAKPRLPDWIFEYGTRDVTLYHVLAGLGIVAIWWAEQSWLAKASKKDESLISPVR